MALSLDILHYNIFGNSILNLLYFGAVIIGAVIAGKILYWFFKGAARKITGSTKTNIDDIIIDMMEEPAVLGIIIVGLFYALKFLTLPLSWKKYVEAGFEVLITINVIWFVSRLVDSLIEHYVVPLTGKTDTDLDDQILPIVRKLSGVLIWSIGLLFLLNNLGFEVTSLIAGLGIGGLAVAFAVKDMLSHFFGGVTILTDKPFKIGQRVRVAGYDGIVKEIGIRSTKITTLDGTELVVPNGTIANEVIENVSREEARKIKMIIGLEYDTSVAKLEKAKKIIRDIIKKNQSTKDESKVFFTEFADSSLNITVMYWIKDQKRIFEAQDEINTAIKKEFEKAKIEMAFPTQTIYLKK